MISASTERKLPTTVKMSNSWRASQEWKTDSEVYERPGRPDETTRNSTDPKTIVKKEHGLNNSSLETMKQNENYQ